MDTTFIDELASGAPTPGGGGACAYCGALAAALASMVGNLTVGKKTYAAVEDQVKEHLAALEGLRADLLALVDADAEAFGPLAAAYRLPKDTPEEQEAKQVAIQKALLGATTVPLDIMRTAAAVVEHTDYLAHFGSRMARSDAGVSAAFARAAVEGASLNVYINVASMDDSDLAAALGREADELVAGTRERCDKLLAYVFEAIS